MTLLLSVWYYLSSTNVKETLNIAKPQLAIAKTFIQTLNNVCNMSMSQLPQPRVKEDMITITNLEDEYLEYIQACNNNLYIHILWPKRVSLLKKDALSAKISIF